MYIIFVSCVLNKFAIVSSLWSLKKKKKKKTSTGAADSGVSTWGLNEMLSFASYAAYDH